MAAAGEEGTRRTLPGGYQETAAAAAFGIADTKDVRECGVKKPRRVRYSGNSHEEEEEEEECDDDKNNDVSCFLDLL